MTCRKCRVKRNRCRLVVADEPLRAMAVGGGAIAVARSGWRTPAKRRAVPDEVEVAECGHVSLLGHSRFCEDCSAERWCCGDCGLPLTREDLFPCLR